MKPRPLPRKAATVLSMRTLFDRFAKVRVGYFALLTLEVWKRRVETDQFRKKTGHDPKTDIEEKANGCLVWYPALCCTSTHQPLVAYRGTSLIRNCTPHRTALGPQANCRVLGGGSFL